MLIEHETNSCIIYIYKNKLQFLWFSLIHKNQHSKFQLAGIEDLARVIWLPL